MKTAIKKILVRWNIYHFIRYSFLYDLYARVFKPDLRQQHKKEIDFYRSFLGDARLIFDIGAYDGHKTAAFLPLAKKIISCEPDPMNYSILEIRFRRKSQVLTRQVALSDTRTIKEFYLHYPGSAFNTLAVKWKNILVSTGKERYGESFDFLESFPVPTTTLDLLIAEFGVPDFIKIDVEGHEQNVLQGLSVPVPCLSIEANLPDFLEEAVHCVTMLHQLDSESLFNYAIDEKLQLPAFAGYHDFVQILSAEPMLACEIICKMNR